MQTSPWTGTVNQIEFASLFSSVLEWTQCLAEVVREVFPFWMSLSIVVPLFPFTL